MKTSPRDLAGAALIALSVVGCGGNSGTQPTSLNRSLTIGSGTAYAATSTAPVDTVDGRSVAPLAVLASPTAQQVVLWGSRDAATGAVTGVCEAVYTADDVKPLYAKYNADGGLTSVKDSDTGSYVTLSALDGSSIVATGVDGTTGKTSSIRATLSDVGVTVAVLDDGSGHPSAKPKIVPFADLVRPRGEVAATDPLAGLSTVYHDSETRTKIIAAIFRAASLVVQKPFDKIVSNVAGYLLLDQLEASYQNYTAKGVVPGTSTQATTPLPYVADLP